MSRYYDIQTIGGKEYMFAEVSEYYRNGQIMYHIYEKADSKRYTNNDIRIYDDVDYPFEPDPEVLGKWTAFCFSTDMEHFNPYNIPAAFNSIEGDLAYRSLEFMDDGTVIHTYCDGCSSESEWTKGRILQKWDLLAPAYEIRNVGNINYLFVEWKSGDYVFGRNKPHHYVFIKQ